MVTATVSHDMRTPLNSIIGMMNNFDHLITDQRGKKMLRIMHNSSKMLLFLVNDLLDFFQLKNGKFKINLKETNLKNLINNLFEMF